MKDKIMPPLVLTIICIVVSGLLDRIGESFKRFCECHGNLLSDSMNAT